MYLNFSHFLHSKQCWVGCFNPNLGKIWTNPNVGFKMSFQILTQLQLSLLNYIYFFIIAFLTQHLGLSIFDPNLGWNKPAFLECINILMQWKYYF